MASNEVKDLTLTFARRVVSVYVQGAIQASHRLNIDEFVMFAPDKEVKAGTTKTTQDGWRYIVLSDGSIYIGSIAIQQMAVSLGMGTPKASKTFLPWLCNMVNPRLKPKLDGSRIVGAIIQSHLMQSGDVERNPGPSLSLCAMCLSVFFLINYGVSVVEFNAYYMVDIIGTLRNIFTDLRSGGRSVFYWTVGDWLDNRAYDCARQRVDIENTRWALAQPIIGWIGELWADVKQETTTCRMILRYWGCDYIDEMRRENEIYRWWAKGVISIVIGVCCLYLWSCTSVVVGLIYWLTRGVKKVIVRNDSMFPVNEVKDQFRDFVGNIKDVDYRPGEHRWLAAQRRMCEAFAFDMLSKHSNRVRDVGGSRSRWKELGHVKHVCGPLLINDDNLRHLKAHHHFENCNVPGEVCPRRFDIPAAVLSHVDYHMTLEQLCDVVTGPTFVINHDFERHRELGVNYVDGKRVSEATVVIEGGKVSMEVAGGTPYNSHPYHLWRSEGSCVTKRGAFVYVRLGDLGETSVYFCYPADGTYDVDDPNVLTTKSGVSYPRLSGYDVNVSDDGRYVFRRPGQEFEFDGAVINEAALTMASAVRDDKYRDTLRSYLSGKFRANQMSQLQLVSAVQLVAYLSDRYAVDLIPSLTTLDGNPLHYGFLKIMYLKWKLGVLWNLGWLRVFLRRKLSKRVAPWLFTTVKVPVYEKMVLRNRSGIGSSLRHTFNKNKFRPEAPPVVSGISGCGQRGAGQDDDQHDNFPRDAGVKRESKDASLPPSVSSSGKVSLHADVPGPSIAGGGEIHKCETGQSQTVRTSFGFEGVSVSGASDSSSEGSVDCEPSAQSSEFCPFVLNYCYTEDDAPTFTVSGGSEKDSCLRFDPAFQAIVDERAEGGCVDLCCDIEAIVGAVWRPECTRFDFLNWTIWCFNFFRAPVGKFSDKSSVPKGFGVLPISPGTTCPPGYKAYVLRDVGVAVPDGKTSATEGGLGKGSKVRGREKGRFSEKFFKNRNKRQARRSS
nr:MAG: hypothetical protein [Picornaviridae sp.]